MHDFRAKVGCQFTFITHGHVLNKMGCNKCKAKKNQQLKTLISNKAKKPVNESATKSSEIS